MTVTKLLVYNELDIVSCTFPHDYIVDNKLEIMMMSKLHLCTKINDHALSDTEEQVLLLLEKKSAVP